MAVSLFLAVLTILVLALGLLWKGRFDPLDYPLRKTAISWHWTLGLLLPLTLHVYKRWPRPRRVDFFSRRGALRAAMAAPLAVLGFYGYAQVAGARELAQLPVRFTGSRRAGWYSGNDFPLTHNFAPNPAQIAPQNWQLSVSGAVRRPLQLDYQTLTRLPTTAFDANIDCTLGWYARQSWQGVPQVDLLDHAGLNVTPTGIELVSVTGYTCALLSDEARRVLFATHVSGETLSSGHGFPLRAVVPTRRGWFWVKWLAEIRVKSFGNGI